MEWDPRLETLCDFVSRKRNAEQMDGYNDHLEREYEQTKARGFHWVSAVQSPNTSRRQRSLSRRRARATTRRRDSARLTKRATRRVPP